MKNIRLINNELIQPILEGMTGQEAADVIHPSEQGHKAIFDRISIDCPFLLNT